MSSGSYKLSDTYADQTGLRVSISASPHLRMYECFQKRAFRLECKGQILVSNVILMSQKRDAESHVVISSRLTSPQSSDPVITPSLLKNGN